MEYLWERELLATPELAETQKNASLIQRIRELRRTEKRTINLSPNEYRRNAIEAVAEWVEGWNADLNVACCWHASSDVRNEQRGHSDAWLQGQLSIYFKSLLALLYKDIPVRKRPELARLITLEHTDGVGWHAHGLLSKPSHLSFEQFSEVLRATWKNQIGIGEADLLGDRAFWCEELQAGYLRYILKSACDKDGLRYGELKGTVDLKNTRRP